MSGEAKSKINVRSTYVESSRCYVRNIIAYTLISLPLFAISLVFHINDLGDSTNLIINLAASLIVGMVLVYFTATRYAKVESSSILGFINWGLFQALVVVIAMMPSLAVFIQGFDFGQQLFKDAGWALLSASLAMPAIIFVIIFGFKSIFAAQDILFTNANIMTALRRSFRLTSGRAYEILALGYALIPALTLGIIFNHTASGNILFLLVSSVVAGPLVAIYLTNLYLSISANPPDATSQNYKLPGIKNVLSDVAANFKTGSKIQANFLVRVFLILYLANFLPDIVGGIVILIVILFSILILSGYYLSGSTNLKSLLFESFWKKISATTFVLIIFGIAAFIWVMFIDVLSTLYQGTFAKEFDIIGFPDDVTRIAFALSIIFFVFAAITTWKYLRVSLTGLIAIDQPLKIRQALKISGQILSGQALKYIGLVVMGAAIYAIPITALSLAIFFAGHYLKIDYSNIISTLVIATALVWFSNYFAVIYKATKKLT
jgi:hypothetical protein